MSGAVAEPEPFESERLVMRPFETDDVEEFHAYMRLPSVCRWIPMEPLSVEQVRERVQKKMQGRWEPAGQRALSWAVVRREDGRLIGDLCVFTDTEPVHRQAEFGYCFHPEVAGRGYATEAVRALLDWAFAHLDLHRVTARVDTDNIASWQLCERIGLRREAHLRGNEWFKGRWSDEYDYAIRATEWERSVARATHEPH